MSTATASAPRTKDEQLAKRRRVQNAKAVVAVLLFLVLSYAGFQGRQHSRLQARLDNLLLSSDQLQQKLNEAGQSQPSNPQITSLATSLKAQLEQFESDYAPVKSAPLEFRLSQATMANAEHRFADALILITGDDEKGRRAGATIEISLLARVLQVRGDAFYGLQKWSEALECYRQLLALRPNRNSTKARLEELTGRLAHKP